MSIFSERLKQLRIENKVYQKTIAQHLGITIRAYQLYESGNGYPSLQGLIGLADYFDVSIDYITGRTDNPNINK